MVILIACILLVGALTFFPRLLPLVPSWNSCPLIGTAF